MLYNFPSKKKEKSCIIQYFELCEILSKHATFICIFFKEMNVCLDENLDNYRLYIDTFKNEIKANLLTNQLPPNMT